MCAFVPDASCSAAIYRCKRLRRSVEDIVGGGFAGEAVEVPQRCVEIEQQHLMRHPRRDRGERGVERGEGSANRFKMAEAGENTGFALADRITDLIGERVAERGAVHLRSGLKSRQRAGAIRERLPRLGRDRTCCADQGAASGERRNQLLLILPQGYRRVENHENNVRVGQGLSRLENAEVSASS